LLGKPAEAAIADAPALGAGPGLLFGHLLSVLTIPKHAMKTIQRRLDQPMRLYNVSLLDHGDGQ
jgi:hypothetical protein